MDGVCLLQIFHSFYGGIHVLLHRIQIAERQESVQVAGSHIKHTHVGLDPPLLVSHEHIPLCEIIEEGGIVGSTGKHDIAVFHHKLPVAAKSIILQQMSVDGSLHPGMFLPCFLQKLLVEMRLPKMEAPLRHTREHRVKRDMVVKRFLHQAHLGRAVSTHGIGYYSLPIGVGDSRLLLQHQII